MGSLSWTSRTFYFLDSRDLLEVLRDFLGREREGVPRGSSRTLGDPPWGSLSLPRKSSENLEEVPRIREGEGSRRSEIMNPSNNDYWVLVLLLFCSSSPRSTVSCRLPGFPSTEAMQRFDGPGNIGYWHSLGYRH